MGKRLVGHISRKIRAYVRLASDTGAVEATRFAALRAMGSKKPHKLCIHGAEIMLRPASPDIGVIRSCLGDEFECLRYAYPTDAIGLILDAGGYIGAAAIALARMYPKATIVTVEPSTENFALLEYNIAPYPNIFAIKAAVAPESEGHMELYDRGTGAWGFTVVGSARNGRVLESVPLVGISDLLDTYGGGRALIAKIDIEGAEVALLRDPGWLDQVGVMMIELHERIVPGCEALFWKTSAQRFVFKAEKEKYVSVRPVHFATVTPGGHPTEIRAGSLHHRTDSSEVGM